MSEAVAFDLQPVLTGERVALRPLLPADYEALYSVASDPLIWEQHPEPLRYTEEVFRTFFDLAIRDGSLAIVDLSTGAIIGSTRFHGFSPERSEVEIGYTFLARSYWNGIYNGEVKRLMLRHAFGSVATVVFLVGPDNFRSQRAVEKIGGVRTGTRINRSGKINLLFEIRRESLR